jgi:hypothetical protein
VRASGPWIVVGAVAALGLTGATAAAIVLNDPPPPSQFGDSVVVTGTEPAEAPAKASATPRRTTQAVASAASPSPVRIASPRRVDSASTPVRRAPASTVPAASAASVTSAASAASPS